MCLTLRVFSKLHTRDGRRLNKNTRLEEEANSTIKEQCIELGLRVWRLRGG